MGSHSRDLSVVQYNDLVCVENRTDSLSHDQHSTVFCSLPESFSERNICLKVKRRETVIKNKYFRMFCYCPCNGQSLFLSA